MAENIPFVPGRGNACAGKSKPTIPSAHRSAPATATLFMEVLVNNKTYTLPADATVESMLHAAGVSLTNGIAVAVNSDVVPRDQWQKCKLNNNDKIMIIKATQGG